eukprot:CAMPEP_0168617158 /NCGR_PEP_ID=MMETSP0449_2-20121227/5400_1 /TAXON_ID=1082188 /ORGANISM="Strombidium rassoulzadegani, Strain ras09" /LENGTH=96 /DNA_ID=CAMNT_0008657969 /DNA_START=592 /DNA_END=882 /DNA_ORIENTATION=+
MDKLEHFLPNLLANEEVLLVHGLANLLVLAHVGLNNAAPPQLEVVFSEHLVLDSAPESLRPQNLQEDWEPKKLAALRDQDLLVALPMLFLWNALLL